MRQSHPGQAQDSSRPLAALRMFVWQAPWPVGPPVQQTDNSAARAISGFMQADSMAFGFSRRSDRAMDAEFDQNCSQVCL